MYFSSCVVDSFQALIEFSDALSAQAAKMVRLTNVHSVCWFI